MSCTLALDPGGRPVVVSSTTLASGNLVTWANPEDMHCGTCDWRVGPQIPGGTPATTLPYEIISGRNGATGTATGVSALDVLGIATELVYNAAARRGIRLGQYAQLLRPACGCYGECFCGRFLSRVPVPDDTCEVLEVLIGGVPLRASPPGTITSVSNPLRMSSIGETLTVTPGSNFTGSYTWLDDVGVTHTSDFNYLFSVGRPFSSSRTIINTTGLNESVNLPPRPAWRLAGHTGKQRWLERLNPNAVCPATCSCGADPGDPRWPTCQRDDLPDTEPCTWSISVLRGKPLPLVARNAVAALACTLAPAVAGLPCQLPQPLADIKNGSFEFNDLVGAVARSHTVFGVREVDMFLSTYKMPKSYSFARHLG